MSYFSPESLINRPFSIRFYRDVLLLKPTFHAELITQEKPLILDEIPYTPNLKDTRIHKYQGRKGKIDGFFENKRIQRAQ